MQNRTILVVLRPIFCEKLKIAPPIENSPPSNVWISDLGRKKIFFRDHLILGGKNVKIFDFGRKISLNFGEDLFFGDHLILGEKNVKISDFGRKISLNFGEDLILGGKNV